MAGVSDLINTLSQYSLLSHMDFLQTKTDQGLSGLLSNSGSYVLTQWHLTLNTAPTVKYMTYSSLTFMLDPLLHTSSKVLGLQMSKLRLKC